MDFTLQELTMFSYAVEIPFFQAGLLTAIEGARASSSLPGFHPAWLDMASHFGLQVGKTWKRRLLTDQNYMLSALALGAV